MKFTKLASLFVFGIMLASCGSSDDEAPVITITSPEDNITIAAGDTINLAGTVTDNEELSSIVISGSVETETITTFDSVTSHDINFNFIVPADSPEGTLEFIITAEDAEENSATETRTLTVQ